MLPSAPAMSADLYRAVLHAVWPDGKYEKAILNETINGVSSSECDRLRKKWLKEKGPMMDSAEKVLRKPGDVPGSYRVECELISN